MEVSKNELEKVEYVDYVPDDGRIIFSQVYYDANNEFNDPLSSLKIVGYYKSTYWGINIVDSETDFNFKLLNLLGNKYSFKRIFDLSKNIEQDLFNFGAIIQKQQILWDYTKKSGLEPIDITDLYMTEVEYLMGLIKSFYDLLYDILLYLRKKYEPKLPSQLPSKSSVLFNNINENGINEVSLIYSIKDPIKDFLLHIKPLFLICREFRNNIYHGGRCPEIIFITEKGPGISIEKDITGRYNPFHDFKEFFENDDHYNDNLVSSNIGSLFYFINKLIKLVIGHAESFAEVIEDVYPSQQISEEYSLYLRGPTVKYINEIPKNMDKCWL